MIEILEAHLTAHGFGLEKPEQKIDYGSLFIPRERLAVLETIVQEVVGNVEYKDIREGGYGECQLLNETFGVDCVYLGPGPEKMAHQVDEYVSIPELRQAREVYRRLIAHYCSL